MSFVSPYPESVNRLLEQAQRLTLDGRLDDAVARLERAQRLDPDHPRAKSLHARLCVRLGRPIEAMQVWAGLIQAGRFHPHDIAPFISTFERFGDPTLARTLVGKLWERHSGSKILTEFYVEVCLVGLDAEHASHILQVYRETSPSDGSFDDLIASTRAQNWTALARYYFRLKKYATSEVLAEHALSRSPGNHATARLFAHCLSLTGQWKRALRVARVYAALSKDADVLLLEGTEELADPQAYCHSLMKHFGLDSNTWIFVAHAKTGDHFYFFSLMKAFKEQQRRTGATERVTILINPSHSGIAELFADDLDRVEPLERCNVRAIRAASSQLRPGVPLIANPVALLENLDGSRRTLFPNSIVRFSDWLKFALGLPPSAGLSMPKVSDANRQAAADFMREHDIPWHRSVILAPAATSMPELPVKVWELLASNLQRLGYSLFLNVGPERKAPSLPGVRTISYPHNLAIPLVEAAGWIIANRSGLADIVAPARARVTVVYARPLRNASKPWPYRHRWALNHFEVPDRQLEEIECFTDEPPELTAQRILDGESRASALSRGAAE